MTRKSKHVFEDDFANGAETVEIVFGIVFAVGLGAALLAFQGTIYDGFTSAKNSVANVFTNLSNASNKGHSLT